MGPSAERDVVFGKRKRAMDKISVILAAYRGEKFIGEQLESLRLQTRLPDELLIGDDSGTDDATARAVQDWIRSRKPLFEVCYFRNTPPLGVNGNFRSLGEKASGDIVFFCDQDDYWLPEKIARLAAVLENRPEAEAVCGFSFLTDGALVSLENQDGSEMAAVRKTPPEKLFRAFLRNTVVGNGHNIAIRKRFLDRLPVWDGLFLYDAWLLRSCAAAEKLLFLPERLTLHRVHGANLTIGPRGNTGGRLHPRLRELLCSPPPVDEFQHLLAQWELFRKNFRSSPLAPEVPAHNSKLLDECIAYYRIRIDCRRRPLPARLFIPPELFKGYFRFGNRFRSIVRDLAGL